MKFSGLVGNEKIKAQLEFLMDSGRLPHAIILEGEEGLGRHTLAREIALCLMCRGDERPCRTCAQCTKVLKGIHPDVYEYTAPDKPAGFHVDTVRQIREDAFLLPNEAEYKVYILGNAQSMNASSQNALLKILEEPPSYAVFLLCVKNKSALLDTVLSRCVVLTMESVTPAEGAEYICAKNDTVGYDEALEACEVWHGNIGKALDTLQDGRLAEISTVADSVAQAVLADNEYELLKECAVFQKDSEKLLATLSVIKALFRDALMRSTTKEATGGETAARLSSRLTADKLLRLMSACDTIRTLTEKNGNNGIIITKLCYELRRAIGR